MSKPKIIDLVVAEDGTYSTKDTLNINKISKLKGIKPVVKKEDKNGKPKYVIPSGVDEFLSGMDVGLDLVDVIKVRAMRIMGLRD
jgi:hypothetical protein